MVQDETERLVSYEVALLAREMGFNEPCEYFAWVDAPGKEAIFNIGSKFLSKKDTPVSNHVNLPGIVTIPTKSQLLLWLWTGSRPLQVGVDIGLLKGFEDRIKNETFITEQR